MSTFIKKLSKIQSTLKAPKNLYNKFGKYVYRSAEDILEAVKPLLAEHELVLTISDELIVSQVGSENYIRSVATITDGTNSISNAALAREALEQKGMSSSQLSGSTSSYARKYALNGLFLIDDTKDADATNTHGEDTEEKKSAPEEKKAAPTPAVSTEKKPAPSFKRPVKQDSGDL